MADDAPYGWYGELERERDRKDEYLGEHPHSPLPATDRTDFTGLEYYEPHPALRFEVPLHRHDEVETISLETTEGGERTYDRVGAFTVSVEGTPVTLQAYEPAEPPDRLWVPFRDATSGEETYGGGRYLDLDDPGDRANGDGDWILDFNRAYNPFCAYSPAYECALVPSENWLQVPIRAGEKAYEGTDDASVPES